MQWELHDYAPFWKEHHGIDHTDVRLVAVPAYEDPQYIHLTHLDDEGSVDGGDEYVLCEGCAAVFRSEREERMRASQEALDREAHDPFADE